MISIINKKDLICMYKIHENAYREEPKPWYEP